MPRPKYAPGSTHIIRVKRLVRPEGLRTYLASRLSLPQGWTDRLFDAGLIRIESAPADGLGLEPGHAVEVTFPEIWPPHLQPVAMPLSILYEDEHLLALDKPPGVVVHPARGHMHGRTLQNGVLHHCRDRIGRPGTSIGPAHRLDQDTSGVILYSLTTATHRQLVELFATRHPHKEYLAIVDGRPAFEQTEIRAPLGVDDVVPARISVTPEHEGGKPAATRLYVVEAGDDWALLRANPLTGRPHQVRVHCRHAGHPVIADRDYNPHPERRPMPRQALHAAALCLDHPMTGQRLRLEAPLPRDMTDLLDHLKGVRP